MTVTRIELVSLIETVMKENSRKGKSAHFTLCKAKLLSAGYEEYLDTALDVVLGLLYKRADSALHPPSSAELDAKAAKRRAEYAEEDRDVPVVKAMLVGRMLDMVTPNGKPLGDCTGDECVTIGGFYEQVGNEAGHDLVRDRLTEERLQAIVRDTFFGDDRAGSGLPASPVAF